MKKKWMEEVNYDEMQIKILLYNGYEELLEKVILLRDVLFNWDAACIRVSTTCPTWNYPVINRRGCL